MPRVSSIVTSFGLCATATALSTQGGGSASSSSRRAFLGKVPVAASGLAMADVLQHGVLCTCAACLFPATSGAFERRDVGGDKPSALTYAFNERAYETQSRMEANGFKFETQEEQSRSLTAVLADYSYAPTSSKSNKAAKMAKEAKKN